MIRATNTLTITLDWDKLGSDDESRGIEAARILRRLGMQLMDQPYAMSRTLCGFGGYPLTHTYKPELVGLAEIKDDVEDRDE